MKIASAFLTSFGSGYTPAPIGTCDSKTASEIQLFLFNNEPTQEMIEETVKNIKGIDGKKHEAIEKTYTEVINGFEWNVVEQTYTEKDGNKVKITTNPRRLVKNYDGEKVEFTLTKKIQEVCNPNSTHIEKITTEKESTKYHVITLTSIEKKEIVGSKTYTNSKKTEKKEYLTKECKMPNGFIRDVLQF